MEKKIIKFNDTGIEKYKFHQYKSPILINELNINKVVVSNRFPFGKRDFNILLVTKIIQKSGL